MENQQIVKKHEEMMQCFINCFIHTDTTTMKQCLVMNCMMPLHLMRGRRLLNKIATTDEEFKSCLSSAEDRPRVHVCTDNYLWAIKKVHCLETERCDDLKGAEYDDCCKSCGWN